MKHIQILASLFLIGGLSLLVTTQAVDAQWSNDTSMANSTNATSGANETNATSPLNATSPVSETNVQEHLTA